MNEEQIRIQKDWEAHCVERGIERFRESQFKEIKQPDGTSRKELADIGETQGGMIVLKNLMGPLTPVIEAMRMEAIEGIQGVKGREPDWWWYIAWLPADKLAFMTIRAVLAEKPHTADQGRKFNQIALRLGKSIKEQIEFDRWLQQSKQKAKDMGTLDFAQFLINNHRGPVNRRAFARWKRRCADILQEDWSSEICLKVGARLLEAMHMANPDAVETYLHMSRGKTTRMLRLSESILQDLTSINERLEVNRPYLLPMKCPPRPWRRVSESQRRGGQEASAA